MNIISKHKNFNFISRIQSHPFEGCFCFAIFFFVFIGFLPVFIANYVPQDQWRAFTYGTAVDGIQQFHICKDRVFNFYLSTGRPLVYIPECVEHSFISTISDFCILRIPSLLITFASMLIGGKIFREITNNYWHALLLTLPLVFAPGYAFMFYQGYTAAGVLASIGLSLASLYYLIEGWGKGETHLNTANKIFVTLLGIILFFISLCNYAAFAFIVIPLVFFIAAFSNNLSNIERIKFLIITYAIYGATCIFYLFFVKLTTLHIPHADLGAYQVSIASYPIIIEKTHRIVNEVFLNSTFVNYKLSIFILLTFVIISAFFIPQSNKKYNLNKSIFAALIYIALFPIVAISSSAPVIISYFDNPLTRHTLPPLFMMAFCLLFSLIKIAEISNRENTSHAYNKFINIILLCIAIALTVQQLKISINLIQDSTIELFAIKSKVNKLLTKNNIANGMHIHVLRPQNGSFIGPTWFKSMEYAPAITQNPEHIKQIITMLLKNRYAGDNILQSISIRDCQLDIKCGTIPPGPFEIVITQSYDKNINLPWREKSVKRLDLSTMHT